MGLGPGGGDGGHVLMDQGWKAHVNEFRDHRKVMMQVPKRVGKQQAQGTVFGTVCIPYKQRGPPPPTHTHTGPPLPASCHSLCNHTITIILHMHTKQTVSVDDDVPHSVTHTRPPLRASLPRCTCTTRPAAPKQRPRFRRCASSSRRSRGSQSAAGRCKCKLGGVGRRGRRAGNPPFSHVPSQPGERKKHQKGRCTGAAPYRRDQAARQWPSEHDKRHNAGPPTGRL